MYKKFNDIGFEVYFLYTLVMLTHFSMFETVSENSDTTDQSTNRFKIKDVSCF